MQWNMDGRQQLESFFLYEDKIQYFVNSFRTPMLHGKTGLHSLNDQLEIKFLTKAKKIKKCMISTWIERRRIMISLTFQ